VVYLYAKEKDYCNTPLPEEDRLSVIEDIFPTKAVMGGNHKKPKPDSLSGQPQKERRLHPAKTREDGTLPLRGGTREAFGQ